MKRFLAILLCLLLVLGGMTACKPDNITYPTEITDPDENNAEDTPAEGKPSEKPEQTPSKEPEEAPPAAEDAEQTDSHPYLNKNGAPSKGVGITLPIGGFIKDTTPADALKDKTITLYTAREEAAFNYVNKKGATVSEWDWIKSAAAEYGFTVKLNVKSADLSLKSQRVALMAGKVLSVLQLRKEDLAQGMTLARSASELVDRDIATFGISNAVLTQSNDTLFAPLGYAETLWYNPALMPENMDPASLSGEGKWTLETFKTVYDYAAQNEVLPLQMDVLPWATLSGKSPLTLKEGKLDHNLYAKDTREAFQKIRAVFTTLAKAPQETATETYNFKSGNTAMVYTALPEQGEGVTANFVPLPTLEEGKPGGMTFGGTFMALPKYTDKTNDAAALSFIELWCNRFTEAHAAALMAQGMKAKDYVNFTAYAEQNGVLILHSPEIEELAETYLSGLTDEAVDMEKEYGSIKTKLTALVTRHNLYY